MRKFNWIERQQFFCYSFVHNSWKWEEKSREIVCQHIAFGIFALQGVGVERVFPLHAPQVASIEVVRRGKVCRSKLYYLREWRGKFARVKQRFDRPLEKVQW